MFIIFSFKFCYCSCISEINKKEGDIAAAQMTLQQLQDRDQLLSAQNEMLKVDKTNLKRRVAELDEMVKTILGTPTIHQPIQHPHTSKPKACFLFVSTRIWVFHHAGNFFNFFKTCVS